MVRCGLEQGQGRPREARGRWAGAISLLAADGVRVGRSMQARGRNGSQGWSARNWHDATCEMARESDPVASEAAVGGGRRIDGHRARSRAPTVILVTAKGSELTSAGRLGVRGRRPRGPSVFNTGSVGSRPLTVRGPAPGPRRPTVAPRTFSRSPVRCPSRPPSLYASPMRMREAYPSRSSFAARRRGAVPVRR